MSGHLPQAGAATLTVDLRPLLTKNIATFKVWAEPAEPMSPTQSWQTPEHFFRSVTLEELSTVIIA